MNENSYSKREQDHFYNDIKERLEKQDLILNKILEQATKTNRRVNALEFWRNAIGWGFGVFITITLFVINYFKK